MKDIIFLAANGNYTQHVAVTIQSVIENNRERDMEFHLIYSGLNKVDELVNSANQNNYKLYLHEVEEEDFEGYPISNHISYSTYYRFLIPNYIDETVEKVLYIDSDLLVVGSLKELLDLDLEDNYIAAGLDLYCEAIGKVVLEMPAHYSYFNAGVMMLNIKKIRKDDIFNKAVNFMLENLDKIKWHDQDALNAVIDNKIIVLDKKWNLNSHYFNVEHVDYKECDCRIVHFTGPLKPWDKQLNHPMKSYYYKYLANTTFYTESNKVAKNESLFIRFLRKHKFTAYRILRKLFSKNEFTREHLFLPINDKFNLNKLLFNKFKCENGQLISYKNNPKVIDKYGRVMVEGKVKPNTHEVRVEFIHNNDEKYDLYKNAVINVEEETYNLEVNKNELKEGKYQIKVIQNNEEVYLSHIVEVKKDRIKHVLAAVDEVTYYTKYVKLHGWAVIRYYNSFNFEKHLILKDENDKCYKFPLKMVERRDITDYLNEKYNYDDAGFLIYINKEVLDPGLYTIIIELTGPDEIKAIKEMNDYIEIS